MNIEVLTWRIGKTAQEDVERAITTLKSNGLEYLKKNCGSIFWLETCQRLLIVIHGNTKFIEDIVYSADLKPPERFKWNEGLNHLLEIVASLDSIVVGEDQILHQFKAAYRESEPYMDKILKRVIQGVIRAGKRVRSQTVFQFSRKSTISVVLDFFHEELVNATEIAVIGSGKMATIIVETLKNYPCNISVYSRSESRINLEIKGIKIVPLKQFNPSDIIFIASRPRSPKLGIKDFRGLKNNCIIFDFGMPRQTEDQLADNSSVKVYTLENLLEFSKNDREKEKIEDLRIVLNRERERILREIKRLRTARIWEELRVSLISLAKQEKALFLNPDPESEKQFRKFINKIIHVTQKKVEEVIIGK